MIDPHCRRMFMKTAENTRDMSARLLDVIYEVAMDVLSQSDIGGPGK